MEAPLLFFLPNLPVTSHPVAFHDHFGSPSHDPPALAFLDELTSLRREVLNTLLQPPQTTSFQQVEATTIRYLTLLAELPRLPATPAASLFTWANFTVSKSIDQGSTEFETRRILLHLGLWLGMLGKKNLATSPAADENAPKNAMQAFLKAAGVFTYLANRILKDNLLSEGDIKPAIVLGLAETSLAEAQAAAISLKQGISHGLLASLVLFCSEQYNTASRSIASANMGKTDEKFLAFLDFKAGLFLAKAHFHHGVNLYDKPQAGDAIRVLQDGLAHLDATEKTYKKFCAANPKTKEDEGWAPFAKKLRADFDGKLKVVINANEHSFFEAVPSGPVELPKSIQHSEAIPFQPGLEDLSPRWGEDVLQFIVKAALEAPLKGDGKKEKEKDQGKGKQQEVELQEAAAPGAPQLGTGNLTQARPFQKNSRIVIVGAGASGIHMAYLLTKNGYTNVTILEKDSRVGGKSRTVYHEVDGVYVPFELGTHVATWAYSVTMDLIATFNTGGLTPLTNVEVVSPKLRKSKGQNPNLPQKLQDWTFSKAETYTLPRFLWPIFPAQFQGIPIFLASWRYGKVHRRLFGKYEGIIPPSPSEEKLADLNKSYGAWLRDHRLQALIPLLTVTTPLQGYGTLDSLPAYYGLIWNTPYLVKGFLTRRILAYNNKQGYSHLWNSIVTRANLNTKLNCEVVSINRNLGEEEGPVTVQYRNGTGEQEELEADFLILACPLQHAVTWLTDATPDEQKIFGSLKHTGLISSLVSTTTLAKTKVQMSVSPERVDPESDGSYYAHVYTQREVFPDMPLHKEKGDKDLSIAFQFYQNYDGNREEQAKAQLSQDLQGLGWQNVDILQTYVPEYFPHFNNEEIQQRYPWKIAEMQASKNKTWYLGGAVAFEAIEPILVHNLWMVKNFLGITEEIRRGST